MQTQNASAGVGETPYSRWHADWQSADHAQHYNARVGLGARALARRLEAFNDVSLLKEWLNANPRKALLEIGCATGEFYRYLSQRFPQTDYYGVDISRVVIAEARRKYPQGRFLQSSPEDPLLELLPSLGFSERPHAVYTKDVLHHQVDPWSFLRQLLDCAQETLIFRTRTRDVGPTVLDPELSCQYHYQGWMPYVVFNLEELIDRIRGEVPRAQMIVRRHLVVLGGQMGRYLPKDCYLPETRTAETAIGVFRNSKSAGKVFVEDRPEAVPEPSFLRRWRDGIRKELVG